MTNFKHSLLYRVTSCFVAIVFTLTVLFPPGQGYAWVETGFKPVPTLPLPGTMVTVSPAYAPPIIKGITIHPENPLLFDFIVHPGDDNLEGQQLKEESTKLIKYFMASLTVPEDQMWVNLSPYEKGRIVPDSLGQTEMGRDLLAQDYLLKQLTASLMYPEDELGIEFWDRVYKKAYEKYGTSEIPMNTFNKVWIMPQTASIYENGTSVFVVDSHLKVMLEEDYMAMDSVVGTGLKPVPTDTDLSISSDIIRGILIPAIEKEVNEGKTFANLRQIYNSVILATWYKQNLKESLLGQVYVDQNKTKGIDIEDKQVKEKIYNQYLEAFKVGVYDYIKEDYDPTTQETIPRKYFSGGVGLGQASLTKASSPIEASFGGTSNVEVEFKLVSGVLTGAIPDPASSPVEVAAVTIYTELFVSEIANILDIGLQDIFIDIGEGRVRRFTEAEGGLYIKPEQRFYVDLSGTELIVKEIDAMLGDAKIGGASVEISNVMLYEKLTDRASIAEVFDRPDANAAKVSGQGSVTASSPLSADAVSEALKQLEREEAQFEKLTTFSYSDKVRAARESGRRFLGNLISKEVSTQIDRENDINSDIVVDIIRLMATHDIGGGVNIFGVTISKDYRGSLEHFEDVDGDADLLESIFTELTAKQNQGIALIKDVVDTLTTYILNFAGTEDQKKRFLERILNGEITMAYGLTEPGSPGSDAASMVTTAEWIEDDSHEDGGYWSITGGKHWITVGANASAIIVFAKNISNEGKIDAFIVDLKNDDGDYLPENADTVRVHPQKMSGHLGSGTSQFFFDTVKVPAKNIIKGEKDEWKGKGFKMALTSLNAGRISVASISLGSMGIALEELRKHLKFKLENGGSPKEIEELQVAIKETMQDMFASREILEKATKAKSDFDKNLKNTLYIFEAAAAKLFASEKAVAVAHMAIRLIGLDAAREGHPLERNFRDIKVLTILEGTSQVLQNKVIKPEFASIAGAKGNLFELLTKILQEQPELVPKDFREKLSELVELGTTAAADVDEYKSWIIARRAMDLFLEGRALLQMKKKVDQMDGTQSDLPKILYERHQQRVSQMAERFSTEVEERGDREVALGTEALEAELRETVEEAEMLERELGELRETVGMISDFSRDGVRPLWQEDHADDKEEGYSYPGREGRNKAANARRADVAKDVLGADAESDGKFRNPILEEVAHGDISVALMALEQEKAMEVLDNVNEDLPEGLTFAEKFITTATEDVLGNEVTAEGSGDSYVLNGKKQFVVNGLLADQFIVFAQLNGQLSAFLVNGNQGLTKSATKALGLNKAGLADITFDNINAVLIGGAGDGLEILSFLRQNEAGAQLSIARGQARRLIDEAIAFTKSRPGPEHGSRPDPDSDPIVQSLYDLPPVRELINDAIRLVNAMTEENAVQSLYEVMELMIQAHGGTGYDLDSVVTTMRHDVQTLSVLDADRQRTAERWQMTAASSPVGEAAKIPPFMRKALEEISAIVRRLPLPDRQVGIQIQMTIQEILKEDEPFVPETSFWKLIILNEQFSGIINHSSEMMGPASDLVLAKYLFDAILSSAQVIINSYGQEILRDEIDWKKIESRETETPPGDAFVYREPGNKLIIIPVPRSANNDDIKDLISDGGDRSLADQLAAVFHLTESIIELKKKGVGSLKDFSARRGIVYQGFEEGEAYRKVFSVLWKLAQHYEAINPDATKEGDGSPDRPASSPVESKVGKGEVTAKEIEESLNGRVVTADSGEQYTLIVKEVFDGTIEISLQRLDGKISIHVMRFKVRGNQIISEGLNLTRGWLTPSSDEKTEDLTGKGLGTQIIKNIGLVVPAKTQFIGSVNNERTLNYFRENYYVDDQGLLRRREDDYLVVPRSDAVILGSEVSLADVWYDSLLGSIFKKGGFEFNQLDIFFPRPNVKGVRALKQYILSPKPTGTPGIILEFILIKGDDPGASDGASSPVGQGDASDRTMGAKKEIHTGEPFSIFGTGIHWVLERNYPYIVHGKEKHRIYINPAEKDIEVVKDIIRDVLRNPDSPDFKFKYVVPHSKTKTVENVKDWNSQAQNTKIVIYTRNVDDLMKVLALLQMHKKITDVQHAGILSNTIPISTLIQVSGSTREGFTTMREEVPTMEFVPPELKGYRPNDDLDRNLEILVKLREKSTKVLIGVDGSGEAIDFEVFLEEGQAMAEGDNSEESDPSASSPVGGKGDRENASFSPQEFVSRVNRIYPRIMEERISIRNGIRRFDPSIGEISFYENDLYLGDVIFDHNGESILILGHSGAGKTPLAIQMMTNFQYPFGRNDHFRVMILSDKLFAGPGTLPLDPIAMKDGSRKSLTVSAKQMGEVKTIVLVKRIPFLESPIVETIETSNEHIAYVFPANNDKQITHSVDWNQIRFVQIYLPGNLDESIFEIAATKLHKEIISGEGDGNVGGDAAMEGDVASSPLRLHSGQVVEAQKPGGIDLNPEMIKMDKQGEGIKYQFPTIDPQKIQNINIEGFLPIIINISPITDIPLLLGISDTEEKPTNLGYESLGPLEKKDRFKFDESA